jgi:hypothetical protein
MKNRKREICTSGTVRDEDGNVLIYSANDRGDRGNVGIIRSPIRASILPDLVMRSEKMMQRSNVADSRNAPYGTSPSSGSNSLRLDARKLDYLGPLLSFIGDEFAEIGR